MTRRRAITITTIITAAIIATVGLLYGNQTGLQLPEAPAFTPGFYAVTAVTDGDTIIVKMDTTEEKIRIIGIDTPETKKPNSPVQCYGPQASEFAKKTLTGKSVRLEADAKSDNRDRYGRLLRYVYLQDGSLYEQLVITQGYGFAYTSFPFKQSADFSQWQTQAQTAKVGLWGACKTTETNGKWQTNDL